jgi:hypothetical protein
MKVVKLAVENDSRPSDFGDSHQMKSNSATSFDVKHPEERKNSPSLSAKMFEVFSIPLKELPAKSPQHLRITEVERCGDFPWMITIE